MKKSPWFVLWIMLALACTPFLALAQQPEVNQAVVQIDGETVVMEAVYAQPGQTQIALNQWAQMEVIGFIEKDPQTGEVLKWIDLLLPGNWEVGQLAETENLLYGRPAIRYVDCQTGELWDSSFAYNSQAFSVIIDAASEDYAMLKGRFRAALTLPVWVPDGQTTEDGLPTYVRTGERNLSIGVSSFYVDKHALDQTAAPMLPPLTPAPTFQPTPAPTLAPAPQSAPTPCDDCNRTGVCKICKGEGSVGSGIIWSMCICWEYNISGQCVKCGGAGQYTTPYLVMQQSR